MPLVPSQDGVAVVEKSGIQLRAEVQPGTHSVPNTLTPIKITLTNLAASSVRVSLEDIELELVERGRTSEAMPPQRIKPRPPVGLGIDPASPFASQTPTSGAPVVPQAAGGVPAPTTYSGAAGKEGTQAPLEREIQASAFVGGEIASGQTEEGLVYFETPPKGVGLLRLRVRVHSEDGHTPVEVIEIPYGVQS